MGKVWPADSVAYHESTTALSNVVSLDESPLLEGLIYAGTDDGLLQVTEDGGKNWRKVEAVPRRAASGPTCRTCSRRRATRTPCSSRSTTGSAATTSRTSCKSTDRGRTWTNITGNLPERHDVWSVIQDHVNGNLLFAGTEFGVVHQRRRRRALGAAQGRPAADPGARHGGAEARERSRARHVRPRLLRARRLQRAARHDAADADGEDARLFPLRDAYLLQPDRPGAGRHRRHRRDGAATGRRRIRHSARSSPTTSATPIPPAAKLVLTITDDAGRQIRRLDVDVPWGFAARPGTCASIRRPTLPPRPPPARQVPRRLPPDAATQSRLPHLAATAPLSAPSSATQ